MISLMFYGGAGEIGGNKILLETGQAEVYLDFGESFDFGEDYFYEWLKPYASNGLECFFEFGILPKIPKLYSRHLQPRNADYIYSSSESFLEGEENKDQRRVLDNWLKHFGITLHKAHCSGHAGKSDLEYAIKTISPEILIPIHTQNPEEFKKVHDHVILPKRGETIRL